MSEDATSPMQTEKTATTTKLPSRNFYETKPIAVTALSCHNIPLSRNNPIRQTDKLDRSAKLLPPEKQ